MLRPQIGLSRVSDPLDTFLACTGVERELFAPGLLDETAFGELGDRVGALCEGFGVAPGRFLEPQRHFA